MNRLSRIDSPGATGSDLRARLSRILLRAGVPLIALIAACGGGGGGCGGGCGGCLKPIPGGFPTDSRRHENVIQIRATQGAIDYLSQNGSSLISSLLPGGSTNYAVPACAGGNQQLCCGSGANCGIDINIKGLGLKPNPPKALGLSTRVALTSMNDIQVSFTVGLPQHCHLTIDTSKGSKNKDIGFTGDLTFTVDAGTKLTSMSLENTKIVDLEPAMLKLSPVGLLDQGCNLGNIGFIQNILVGQIATQVSQQVDGALCQTCMTKADCDGLADDCKAGQCMRAGKCLQEIGVAGRIDLASLSALFAGTGAGIDTLAVLGGYAESLAPGQGMNGAGGGLSLGMLGGGQASAHNNCVPMRPAPMAPMVPRWSQEMAGVEPRDMKPYHVGIGIHQSHLDTLGFAAFDGGALCLNVGTAQSAQIDSKLFGIILPSLNDLTHGIDGPMVLAVRPQQAPTITLGEGSFTVDPMTMQKAIKDALLHINIPQLSIDFFAFVEERYVRVMTLTADAAIGVALDADAQGQLVPMISDLNGAFTNVKVTNSELLAEAPDRLAKTFPMLLGLAAGQLGNLAPIALPKVMGIQLSVVGIEPTDNKSFLSIFANLAVSPDAFQATTMGEVVEVLAPPTPAFSVDSGLDPRLQPAVVVNVSGKGHAGDASDLEYSARIDGGLWGLYQKGPRLTVTDPRLWIQGRHEVEVRARVVGEPLTTDREPVVLPFLVDTIAPTGTFDVAGTELTLEASDLVTPSAMLEYSLRLATGEWTPWARLPEGKRVQITGGNRLDENLGARVRDEAGNVGELAFHGRMMAAPGGGGCGCEVGGAERGSSGAPLALMATLLLMMGVARRRFSTVARPLLQRSMRGVGRGPGALTVIALGLAALGCNSDPDMAWQLGKNDSLDPTDEIGRYADAVVADGVIHVSAYDDNFGDLAYAEVAVTDIDKPIAWQWVDGVPLDGSTMPAADKFRHDVTDAGDDVGLYTSIALDKSKAPRIAYYDATHRALKYAMGADHAFTAQTVVAADPGSPVQVFHGRYASLSLDANDVPSIAFMSSGISDGKGGFVSKLRLATARSSAPMGSTDWIVTDVDQTPMPCAGLCAKGEACVPNDAADASKGSSCKKADAACPMACSKTQACLAAACVDVIAPAAAMDLVEGTGLWANLMRLPSGLRAIAYHDRTLGDCKLASEGSPGAFVITTVDGNSPTSDVGQFTTARAAADGTIHVAYLDAIKDQLLYKTVKGGTASATAELIDDGLRSDGPHPVGAGAALWTDGATVKIAYQDQRIADLMVATRAGSGWNHTYAKMGAPGYGFYPKIISDGGTLYVVQFVYDRAAPMKDLALGGLQIAALQ